MKLSIGLPLEYLIILTGLLAIPASGIADSQQMPPPEPYCQWEVKNFAIDEPLCDLQGDVERGRAIATDSYRGNCVACHSLPEEGIEAFGTIGPPLAGIGKRLPRGMLRLRIVDTRSINPMSIMPGFYRNPELTHRPAKGMEGRTFLTAQQVEDVIAYMETLK